MYSPLHKYMDTKVTNNKNTRTVVAHAFHSGIQEAGGCLSSRPAWSTKWVPRTARTTQRNYVSKNQQNKIKQENIRGLQDLAVKNTCSSDQGPRLVPSIHMVAHKCLLLLIPKDPTPTSDFHGHQPFVHIHICKKKKVYTSIHLKKAHCVSSSWLHI